MTIWQKRKRLLKDRTFLLFSMHVFITISAGMVSYIVLTWHVLGFQHNALTATVLMAVCFWLPSILLSPMAGVIVDRYPRRYVIIFAHFVRLLSFAVVGFCLQYHDALWICCVLAVINGSVFSLLGPAFMAFVREIVDSDDLLAANSTIDICIEIGNILGTGFAALLIAVHIAAGPSLYLVSFCIAIGVFLLWFVKQRADGQCHLQHRSHPWQELCDGLSYIKQRPFLMMLYGLNTTLFVQFMISPVLLAPFIKTVLHGSGGDFGAAEFGLSVGIIAGSLLIPYLCEKLGHLRVMCVAIIWVGVLFFFMSITGSIHAVIYVYTLLGVGLPLWSVIASMSQQYTEKSMQGRVQSAFNTINALCILVVYIILSLDSGRSSLAYCYLFSSSLALLALLLCYGISRRMFNTEGEEGADADAALLAESNG